VSGWCGVGGFDKGGGRLLLPSRLMLGGGHEEQGHDGGLQARAALMVCKNSR